MFNLEKTLETQLNGKVGASPSESTTLSIPIAVDFLQRDYLYTYYTLFDFITAMGGFKGFVDPIMMLIIPLLCLSYQKKLAQILKERNSRSMRDDMLQVAKGLRDKIDQNVIKVDGDVKSKLD
jgi:hypothetical protein